MRRFFVAALLLGLSTGPSLAALAEVQCGPVRACSMASMMDGCAENGSLPECCRTEAPAETAPEPRASLAWGPLAWSLEPSAGSAISFDESLPTLEPASMPPSPLPSTSLLTLFQRFLI